MEIMETKFYNVWQSRKKFSEAPWKKDIKQGLEAKRFKDERA